MAEDVRRNPGLGIDSELTAEDFSIVHEKLYKARTKWHNIGLELGVDFETLESICLKFRDCHDECLKKMLACRLQSHGPLTWRGLCDCLKSERVGRNDVAQEIEKWLHPVEDDLNGQKRTKRSSTELPDLDFQPPSKKKKEIWPQPPVVNFDLCKETWDPIEEEFGRLTDSIKMSLESRSIEPREIVASLVAGFNVTQTLETDDKCTIFLEAKKRCEKSKSITDFWLVILDFVTFYSYRLLKLIVHSKYGTSTDKDKLEEYESQFFEYTQKVIGKYNRQCENNGQTEVIVKVKKKFSKISEEHLDEFKKKLTFAIGINSEHLHLIELKPGCTVLTYDAPLIVEIAAFPISEDQKVDLVDLGVILIRCGGHEYVLCRQNDSDLDDDEDHDNSRSPSAKRVCLQQKMDSLPLLPEQQAILLPDTRKPEHGSTDILKLGMELQLGENRSVSFKPSENSGKDNVSLSDSFQSCINNLEVQLAALTKYPDQKSDSGLSENSREDNVSLSDNIESSNNLKVQLAALTKYSDRKSDSGLPSSITTSRKQKTTTSSLYGPDETPLPTLFLSGNVANTDPFESTTDLQYLSTQKMKNLEQLPRIDLVCRVLEGTPSKPSLLRSVEDVVNTVNKKRRFYNPQYNARMNNTMFHNAASSGNLLKLKAYLQLQHYNLQDINKYGNTVLHIAAQAGHLDIVRYLVEESMLVSEADSTPLYSMTNSNGETPLFLACLNGEIQIAKYLLREAMKHQSVEVIANSKTIEGNNILHYVVLSQSMELIKTLTMTDLLPTAELLHSVNKNGRLPIHLACLIGATDTVQYLLHFYSNYNFKDKYGWSLIHFAALSDASDILQYLVLEMNANPHTVDIFQSTPLHFAAASGCLESVQFLIKCCNYTADIQNIEGVTPFFHACSNGDVSVFKYLIEECGCDIFHKTFNDETILHTAAHYGQYEILRYLILEKHYDSQITKAQVRNLLCCLFFGCAKVTRKDLAQFVEIFTKEPRDDLYLNTLNDDSPLISACTSDNIEGIKYFIEDCKCYKLCRNDKGYTLLHYAACAGAFNSVRFLVSNYQFDPVTTLDNEGLTPLHWAALSAERGYDRKRNALIKEHLECLLQTESALSLADDDKIVLEMYTKQLLTTNNLAEEDNTNFPVVHYFCNELKCDVNLVNEECKQTPLHVACENGQLSVVKFLIEKVDCDKSIRDGDGINVLGYAIGSGHLEIIKYLIVEQSCDPNFAVLSEKLSLPNLFFMSGQAFSILKLLLETIRCDLSMYAKCNGRNFLHMACSCGELECVQYLVEKGYDINCRDDEGSTSLHCAAYSGRLNIVEYLSTREEYILESENNYGDTPAHTAAWKGHCTVLKYFKDKLNCNIHSVNKTGLTFLHSVCSNEDEHIDVVQYLVEECGAEITAQDNVRGNSPLHYAALYGHLNITKYLVYEKNSPRIPENNDCTTPVHIAAIVGELEIIKIFRQKFNCDFSSLANKSGETPIHIAASFGYIELLKYFVECCAVDIDVACILLRSPLHYAASEGRLKAVEYLLEKGCKTLCRDIIGNTPPFLAVVKDQLEVVKYFVEKLNYDPTTDSNYLGKYAIHSACIGGSVSLLKYLVEECKCNIERKCELENNITPLFLAVVNGNWDIVTYLTKSTGSINLDDKIRIWEEVLIECGQDTPILHLACGCGQVEIVNEIIELDPSAVKKTDSEGQTPLHYAAIDDQLAVFKLLYSNVECDPMCEDDNGYTPFHCAALYGSIEVFMFLIREKKYNPNFPNSEKEMALHIACTYLISLAAGLELHELKKLNVVTFLMEHCDGVLIRNTYGETPLHLAAASSYLKIIKYLVAKNQQFCNLGDKYGCIPLDYAMVCYNQEVVEFLQQHTTSTHSPPSVIHLSALLGHITLVEHYLTDFQYDSNLQDSIGRTPLHYAAMGGHIDIVKYLLFSCDADPFSEDVFHNLPLHYAAALGYEGVVMLLSLIDTLYSITARGVFNKTAEEMAIAGGHDDAASLLYAFRIFCVLHGREPCYSYTVTDVESLFS